MSEELKNERLTLIERVLRLEQTINLLEAKICNPVVETQCFDMLEACRFLGVSKSTLYRIMRSREIGFITISGHRKFKRSDLEKYIEENSKKAYKSKY